MAASSMITLGIGTPSSITTLVLTGLIPGAFVDYPEAVECRDVTIATARSAGITIGTSESLSVTATASEGREP